MKKYLLVSIALLSIVLFASCTAIPVETATQASASQTISYKDIPGTYVYKGKGFIGGTVGTGDVSIIFRDYPLTAGIRSNLGGA